MNPIFLELLKSLLKDSFKTLGPKIIKALAEWFKSRKSDQNLTDSEDPELTAAIAELKDALA